MVPPFRRQDNRTGLLYIEEHTSCHHYASNPHEGFRLFTLNAGDITEERLEKNTVIFVVRGIIEYTMNTFVHTLKSKEMAFFHKCGECRLRAQTESTFLVAMFENALQGCDLMDLSTLETYCKGISYRADPLDVRPKMRTFLKLICGYLRDGANCVLLHELKLREMFWLFRFYYTKEELATFFYPLVGEDYDFKMKVLQNFEKARTVEQLSSMVGMSLTPFYKRFLAEFHESAGSWMRKQRNLKIKFVLSYSDAPLGEVADELGFSSQAQFSRYCKQNFGLTPSGFRNLLKSKQSIILGGGWNPNSLKIIS